MQDYQWLTLSTERQSRYIAFIQTPWLTSGSEIQYLRSTTLERTWNLHGKVDGICVQSSLIWTLITENEDLDEWGIFEPGNVSELKQMNEHTFLCFEEVEENSGGSGNKYTIKLIESCPGTVSSIDIDDDSGRIVFTTRFGTAMEVRLHYEGRDPEIQEGTIMESIEQ